MLKITADRDARRLVLEGSIAGPWVDTLGASWQEAQTTGDPHDVVVDVSDVTFVDPRGKELLVAIYRAGATLLSQNGINAALIREIAARPHHQLLALIIPLLMLASACSSAGAGETARSEPGRPAVAVSVAPVVAGSLAETIDVTGSLSPKYAADIKSEVSGTVAAVYVTEWVPVKAGSRLARLSTAETDAAVEASKAGESQARVAEARAQREYDRALQLKQYGLITSQALDDARSAVEAAEATRLAAHAQVRAAEARLAKSFITAPMDGVVSMRGVNVGDRVENMGGGEPMFRIVDNRLLDLTVSVPSSRLASVRAGQPLEFTVDALPGRTFTGNVKLINPSVDEASRSGKVVAEVRNPDGALKGGLFVRGRILVSSQADVLQVPRGALLNWNVAAATAEVFVVRDGKAQKRSVQTGAHHGEAVAIAAGLAKGEQVVTRGGFALKAGDRVAIAGEGV